MNRSQNGWMVIDSSGLDRSPIPGTDVVPIPGLRAGDVATVLHEVGRLFHINVAPLYNPGCWGWNAPVPIPGSNVISNHASGTAIDFNAPSFPWQMNRMTAEQRTACRIIVNRMDNLVAWGGDFTTRVDEMHFEINGNVDQIRELANKIRGGLTVEQVSKIYEDMDARNKLEDRRYSTLLELVDGLNKKADTLFEVVNGANVNIDAVRSEADKFKKLIADSFAAVNTTDKRVDKLEKK